MISKIQINISSLKDHDYYISHGYVMISHTNFCKLKSIKYKKEKILFI